MYHTLAEFYSDWAYESQVTQVMLDHLSDASLLREAYPGGRTIGRLAWHIAQSVPEMMARTGVHVAGAPEAAPVPVAAATIADAYRVAAASLVDQLGAHWTDETLRETDDMYGERWTRSVTLGVLVSHQIHHRGQLTVLMRQAGLPIPGIYGPTLEEWATMGAPAPTV
ncbi:MAG: DinB family protein [Gemmatimonadaceae bacterium]|nr:DinB family protein [Gemmatimonadaceae bacterium]